VGRGILTWCGVLCFVFLGVEEGQISCQWEKKGDGGNILEEWMGGSWALKFGASQTVLLWGSLFFKGEKNYIYFSTLANISAVK